MKIYISEDAKKTIRKNYNKTINYKELAIIDVVNLMKVIKFENTLYSTYVLNEEIKKQLLNFYSSKRFKHILYLVKKIDDDFLKIFKDFLKDNNIYFTDYIMIDYSGKVNTDLYQDFDYVI
jgi:hypothetical protein